jgi:hypothetical protein
VKWYVKSWISPKYPFYSPSSGSGLLKIDDLPSERHKKGIPQPFLGQQSDRKSVNVLEKNCKKLTPQGLEPATFKLREHRPTI